MKRRKLPIGIQTFHKIRADDHYYVGKTAFALKLVDEYHKPILDTLQDPIVARKNRDFLRGFLRLKILVRKTGILWGLK